MGLNYSTRVFLRTAALIGMHFKGYTFNQYLIAYQTQKDPFVCMYLTSGIMPVYFFEMGAILNSIWWLYYIQ